MVKYNLDDLVREHIIESLDDNMGYYGKVFFMMKTALRDLNLDLSLCYKTIKIHLDCDNIFIFPNDYIDYTRIYTIDGFGKKFDLGMNINMANDRDCNGALNHSLTQGVNGYITGGQNQFRGRQYGLNNQNFNKFGQYKVNDDHVVFSELNVCDIYLDYVCNETEVNKDTMVHPYLIEPLKQWVRYKMSKDPNLRIQEEKMYFQKKRKLARLMQKFTLSELKQAIRFNYTQTPKR